MTEGLPMDIMHDILEGSLQYEVKELLKYLTSSRLISLDQVNVAIQSFPYGSTDITDKPSPIPPTTLDSEDNRLKQLGIGRKLVCNNYKSAIFPSLSENFFCLASQMWCFARLLPLMIGEKVPVNHPHWENFLLFLKITDYVFSPVTSADIVDYLSLLIHNHHTAFRELYPESSFIPKLHYVIHIPEWMRRYSSTK